MPVSEEQRYAILELLDAGCDRGTIASRVGVTPGQVSAVAAHATMGRYASIASQRQQGGSAQSKKQDDAVHNLVSLGHQKIAAGAVDAGLVIGKDVDTGEFIAWDPFPQTGSANPHVLILGESGFGKTYTVQCLLGEIARAGVPSIIFDYAQGFSSKTLPSAFIEATNPVEINASEDGIAINPLEIFPADLYGPASVAQRVADTFARVYPRIGIQQHAVLRQAVLDVFEVQGFRGRRTDKRNQPVPLFRELQQALLDIASDPGNPYSRVAASAAAHVSTIFIFNTFRAAGRKLDWATVVSAKGKSFILQLKGLETSLEKAVTEFLLWNMIGWMDSAGPSPLRIFVVLDEAHKLSFEPGSPAERLLREGRKFGIGLILASQQAADFPAVAFNNTSTKIVFQTADDHGAISRALFQKARNASSALEVHRTITQLPPRTAYVISKNIGRTATIISMEERIERWRKSLWKHTE